MLRTLLICLALATPAAAQVGLSGLTTDASAPLEIAADNLAVDNGDGTATFTGNVVIGQGDLRLAAPSVEVFYSTNGGISRLVASGGITLATAAEAVEAERAEYDLAADEIVLTGDVLLTQGASAVSAERMRINTEAGTAQLEGRVRTVIQTGQ
ncbi:MAG: lipopolysaccharide transport periplasmic protein LptA [Shimia sp.]